MATWTGPADFTIGGKGYSTNTHTVSIEQEMNYIETSSSMGHHKPKEDWVEQCDHCKYPISHMNIEKVDYGEHVCSGCGEYHEVEVQYICPNCDNQVYPQWTYVPPSPSQRVPGVKAGHMSVRPGIQNFHDSMLNLVKVSAAGMAFDGRVIVHGPDETIIAILSEPVVYESDDAVSK